jgi:hypothetical protein
LKIELRESSPPIWRRIQISEDITLPQLHRTIQIAIGWEIAICTSSEFGSDQIYAV